MGCRQEIRYRKCPDRQHSIDYDSHTGQPQLASDETCPGIGRREFDASTYPDGRQEGLVVAYNQK